MVERHVYAWTVVSVNGNIKIQTKKLEYRYHLSAYWGLPRSHYVAPAVLIGRHSTILKTLFHTFCVMFGVSKLNPHSNLLNVNQSCFIRVLVKETAKLTQVTVTHREHLTTSLNLTRLNGDKHWLLISIPPPPHTHTHAKRSTKMYWTPIFQLYCGVNIKSMIFLLNILKVDNELHYIY